ncbi:MAG TPA: hypothetical protein DCZ91_19150 [Lachnospiraceae bacterium]|nr:hypothetical protein [Lachnospiraceae bacterium]
MLSDAFPVPKEGYEWTAHMLNLNGAGSQKLLKQYPALQGHVTLLEYVREYQKYADRREAIAFYKL